MPAVNISALLFSLGLSLAMAILGGLITGKQLQWFATLKKPRMQIPLWAFMSVGVVGYIFDTIIAYRLLTVVPGLTDRVIALTVLTIVMLYNELWNYVFFRWQSPFAGFLGILAYLAPLLILQVTLFLLDGVSALLILINMAWVIGYDIPWTFSLWKLNPTGHLLS